jgi:hypothetical protein
LQTDDRVSDADAIRTRRLDQGTNVKESNSKVKRALVAVAGAGLMLTAAVTIGLDAWLRRRRRPADPPVPPVPGQVRSSGAADGASAGPRRNWDRTVDANTHATTILSSNGTASGVAAARPSAAGLPAVPSSAASSPAKESGLSTAVVEYQMPGQPAKVDAPEQESEAPPKEVPSDATIVLPRSLPAKESWPDQGGKTQRT